MSPGVLPVPPGVLPVPVKREKIDVTNKNSNLKKDDIYKTHSTYRRFKMSTGKNDLFHQELIE